MNTLDLDVKARALAEGLGLLDTQGALNPEGLRALAAGDAVALGEALDALLTLLPEDEDLGARLLALPEPPGLHLALAADAKTPGQYALGLALTPEGAAFNAAPETSLRLALWLFRLTPGEALVDQQRAQATLSLPMKDGPFAALGLTARHDAEDTALELTLRPRDEDAAPLHIVYPPPPGEGSDAERLALSALPEALKLITLAIPDGPAQAALEALLALVGWLPSARRDGAEAPTTLTLPTLDLAALVADPGAALGAWAGQLIDGEGADARGRRAVALAASVLAMDARDGAALPVTGAEERAAWCATLTEDDAPLALRLELRQLQAGDGPPRLRLGLRVSWGLDLVGGADDQVSARLTALARAELLEITLSERPETRLLPEAELGVELVGVGVGEDGAPRPIVTLAEPELRAGRLRVGLRVDASGALAPDVALYDLRSPALTVDRFDLTSEDNLLLLGAAAAGGGLVALLRWLIGPALFTVAEDAVALFSPLAPVVGAVAVGGVDPVDFGALGPDLGALDRLYGDWMRRLLADEAAFSEWSAAVDAALATWARAVAGEDEDRGDDAEAPAAPPPKTAWSFGPALARVVTEDGPRLEAALMLERRGPLSTGTRRAQLLLGVLDALAFTDAARPVGVRWLPRVGAALRFQAPADAPARLTLSGGATPLTVEAAELALLLGVDRDGVTTADTTLSGLALRQGDAVLAAPERISFASFGELADEAAPRALSLIFASALGPVHDGAARRALALAALFGFTSDSPAWTPLTPPDFKELWADPTRRLPRLLASRLQETAWSGAPGEAPAAALFGSFLRGDLDLSAAPGPVHGAGRPSAPWVVPLLQPGGQTVEALLWIGPEGPALPEAAEDRAAWVERALPSAPGSVEALARRAVAAGPWLDEAAREGLARLGEGGLVALLGALDGAFATSAERPELLTTLRAATANLTRPWALLVGPELDEQARARLALALGVEGEWILSLPLNDGGGPLDRAEAAAWVRAELSLLGGPTLVALGAAAAVARAVDPRAKVVPGGSLEALDAARRLWALGLADDEDTGWQARALRGLAALADAVCAPGATGSWPHDGAAMAGDAGIAAPDAAGLAAAWLNEALRARLQAALETPRAAPTGLGVGLRLRGEAVEGALRGTITAELSLGELDLADGADGARALSAGGFVRAACLLESPGAWVVGDGRSATRLRAVEARLTLLPAPEASARLTDGAWGGMSAGASLDDLGVALLGEADLGSREGAATALVAVALPLALAGAGGLSASEGAALWTTALGALMTGLGASATAAAAGARALSVGPARLELDAAGALTAELGAVGEPRAALTVSPTLCGLTLGIGLPRLLPEVELLTLTLALDGDGVSLRAPVSPRLPLSGLVRGLGGVDLADAGPGLADRALRQLGALGALLLGRALAEEWLAPRLSEDLQAVLAAAGASLDDEDGLVGLAALLSDPAEVILRPEVLDALFLRLPRTPPVHFSRRAEPGGVERLSVWLDTRLGALEIDAAVSLVATHDGARWAVRPELTTHLILRVSGDQLGFGAKFTLSAAGGASLDLLVGEPDAELWLPLYHEGRAFGELVLGVLLPRLVDAALSQAERAASGELALGLLELTRAALLAPGSGLLIDAPDLLERPMDERALLALRGAGERAVTAGFFTLGLAPDEVTEGLRLTLEARANDAVSVLLSAHLGAGAPIPEARLQLDLGFAALALALSEGPRLSLWLDETQALPLPPGLDPARALVLPLVLAGLAEAAPNEALLWALLQGAGLVERRGVPADLTDLRPERALLGAAEVCVARLLSEVTGADTQLIDGILTVAAADDQPILSRPALALVLGDQDDEDDEDDVATPAARLRLREGDRVHPALLMLRSGLRLGSARSPLVSGDVKLQEVELLAIYDDGAPLRLRATLRGFSFAVGDPDAPPAGGNAVAAALLAGRVTTPAVTLVAELTPSPPAFALRLEDAATDGGLLWLDVKERVGPLSVHALGLALSGALVGDTLSLAVSVALNGTLHMGPFAVYVDGLSVSITRDASPGDVREQVVVDLRGLGLSLDQPPLHIAAAFAREEGPDGVAYTGAAAMRLPGFELAAFGELRRKNGRDSFFLVASAPLPVGGPPAFRVTGILAGVGVDRDLPLPTGPESVASHPLVKLLGDTSVDVEQLKELLRGDEASPFPPARGASWFAAGVRFRAFELIHGRLLAVLRLGADRSARIGVLGVADLSLPKDQPVAQIKLGIDMGVELGTSDPRAWAMASILDGSWVLSRDAKLSGDFGLVIWPRRRDFVLSLGGYHPRFQAPDHFPALNRLALTMKVGDHAQLKAEAYMALTPREAMAGAELSLEGKFSVVRVWVEAGLHVLIGWAPFRYDVEAYLSIKVSLFDGPRFGLGVRLHLWGQPFGGKATVSVLFWDVTVRFGEKAINTPLPVETLLSDTLGLGPTAARSASQLDVVQGALSEPGAPVVVRPGAALSLRSKLPATSLTVTGLAEGLPALDPVDLVPCGESGVESRWTVTLRRDGAVVSLAAGDVTPELEPMPAAIFAAGAQETLGDTVITRPDLTRDERTVTLYAGLNLRPSVRLGAARAHTQARETKTVTLSFGAPRRSSSRRSSAVSAAVAAAPKASAQGAKLLARGLSPAMSEDQAAEHGVGGATGITPPTSAERGATHALLRLRRVGRSPGAGVDPQTFCAARADRLDLLGLALRARQRALREGDGRLSPGETLLIALPPRARLVLDGDQGVRVTLTTAEGRVLADLELGPGVLKATLPAEARRLALTGLGQGGVKALLTSLPTERVSADRSVSAARGARRALGFEERTLLTPLGGRGALARGVTVERIDGGGLGDALQPVEARQALQGVNAVEVTVPRQVRSILVRATAPAGASPTGALRLTPRSTLKLTSPTVSSQGDRHAFVCAALLKTGGRLRIELPEGWRLDAVVMDTSSLSGSAFRAGLVESGPPGLSGETTLSILSDTENA